LEKVVVQLARLLCDGGLVQDRLRISDPSRTSRGVRIGSDSEFDLVVLCPSFLGGSPETSAAKSGRRIPTLRSGENILAVKASTLTGQKSASSIVGERSQCLSWVKSAVLTVGGSLPVFPDKRTFSEFVGMSQRCLTGLMRCNMVGECPIPPSRLSVPLDPVIDDSICLIRISIVRGVC
jgi:hypothetical protein